MYGLSGGISTFSLDIKRRKKRRLMAEIYLLGSLEMEFMYPCNFIY
jgi:hypothetical protein